LEDAIGAAFTPKQQVPPAGTAAPMVEQPSPAPSTGPVGGALSPEGAVPQEAAPQEMAPQQRPDIQSLLSGISSAGTPTASVRTSMRR